MKQLLLLSDCENRFFLNELKRYFSAESFDVVCGGYNQVETYLLSELDTIPEYVVILLTSSMLYEQFCIAEYTEKQFTAEKCCDRIIAIWNRLRELGVEHIIQSTFAELPENVWGNYAAQEIFSFTYQVRNLNQMIVAKSQCVNCVRILDIQQIHLLLGNKAFWDYRMLYVAKCPFSLKAVKLICQNIWSIVNSLLGKTKKVVVCDLDGILWGGAIAEDGLTGIQIGEYGDGAVYKDIQRWLLQLKNRGILLTFCSKNEMKDAIAPFEHHSEMLLKLSDFVLCRASWNNKSDEIRDMSKTLNLSLDSFVFLDDNPLERREVKSCLPEVEVPELPDDSIDYLPYIESLCLFESTGITDADLERTHRYKEEISRTNAKNRYVDYNSFLESLNLTVILSEWCESDLDRITQLQMRTNQFNLNKNRLSKETVYEIVQNDNYHTLSVQLEDSFGNYGLIGGIVWKCEMEQMNVQYFFISCRAFKRGVEEFLLNYIVEFAINNHISRIEFDYENTEKNRYLTEFFHANHMMKKSNGKMELIVDKYHMHNTFIKQRSVCYGTVNK